MSPATSVAGLREQVTARVDAQLDAMAAAGVTLSAAERALVDDAVRLAVAAAVQLAPAGPPAGQERDSAGRRRVARCGEVGGYYRHRRLGEEVCAPCREAVNADARERRAAASPGPRGLQPCGTYGAAQRHDKAGEALDDACRAARARYKNGNRADLRARRDLEAAVWGVAA